jgi:hypothetical protein
MKNLMVRKHTFTMLTSRLVAIALFAALLSAVPFHAALAKSASPLDLGSADSFTVLSAAPDAGGAVTLTNATVIGDVGSSGPMASVVQTDSTISGAVIAPVSAQVLTDFNSAYDQYATIPCTGWLDTAYTGATLTLTPGVYCNAAAVTFTDTTLTLKGPSNGIWIFKIGTDGTGALTGTNFSVVMDGGSPCNVYWWVAEAATLTDSNFLGTILAGAAITITRGTFDGDALAKAAVTMTGATVTGCEQAGHPGRSRCNQGVGNGPENCDPGNSNQMDPSRSNDELGGKPGDPGRKGGNGK